MSNSKFDRLANSGDLLKLPGLPSLRKLSGQSTSGHAESGKAKASMHRNGRSLLNRLAWYAHPRTDSVRVSSNLGGPAVSGEVVLHTDWVWAQVSAVGRRLVVMYRRPLNAANSVRWDSDGANRFVYLDTRADVLERELATMLRCFAMWEENGLRERQAADLDSTQE